MAYYYNIHQSFPKQLTVKVTKLPEGCLPLSLGLGGELLPELGLVLLLREEIDRDFFLPRLAGQW